MLALTLYVIAALIVGASVAYHADGRDAVPEALAAALFWPIGLVVIGFSRINAAGNRRRERRRAAAEEHRRQLIIGEAQLNRDGFYGDEVRKHQLNYDRAGYGLYSHTLTSPEAR